MITISTELLFKILIVTLTALHILFDIFILWKFKRSANGKGLTVGELFNKGKEIGTDLITDFLDDVHGAFPKVTTLIKSLMFKDKKNSDKEDNTPNG